MTTQHEGAEPDLGSALAEVRQAFNEMGGVAQALSISFGRCPRCRHRLVTGYWLKWCDNRACQGHVSPK